MQQPKIRPWRKERRDPEHRFGGGEPLAFELWRLTPTKERPPAFGRFPVAARIGAAM